MSSYLTRKTKDFIDTYKKYKQHYKDVVYNTNFRTSFDFYKQDYDIKTPALILFNTYEFQRKYIGFEIKLHSFKKYFINKNLYNSIETLKQFINKYSYRINNINIDIENFKNRDFLYDFKTSNLNQFAFFVLIEDSSLIEGKIIRYLVNIFADNYNEIIEKNKDKKRFCSFTNIERIECYKNIENYVFFIDLKILNKIKRYDYIYANTLQILKQKYLLFMPKKFKKNPIFMNSSNNVYYLTNINEKYNIKYSFDNLCLFKKILDKNNTILKEYIFFVLVEDSSLIKGKIVKYYLNIFADDFDSILRKNAIKKKLCNNNNEKKDIHYDYCLNIYYGIDNYCLMNITIDYIFYIIAQKNNLEDTKLFSNDNPLTIKTLSLSPVMEKSSINISPSSLINLPGMVEDNEELYSRKNGGIKKTKSKKLLKYYKIKNNMKLLHQLKR